MKPWMKWALGCAAVAVLATFALVAAGVGAVIWGKGKLEEMSGGGAAVEAARKEANAVPFSRPTGNIVTEDRLKRYLAVRSATFEVYEKYRSEIEARKKRIEEAGPNLSDFATGLTAMGEVQKAEALALAREKMHEDEYAFIQEQVYKAMFTAAASGRDGKAALDATEVAAKKMAKESAETLEKLKSAGLPKEGEEALRKAMEETSKGVTAATDALSEVEAPPENVALFKKYETELKKYAMPGLVALFGDEKKGAGPR